MVDKISQPWYKIYMDKDRNFGDRVRGLREKQGLSIKNLAKTLEVNYTYLSKIENNKSIPSEELIEKLAHVFNCDPEELKIRAGKIPEDIARIFREHPQEAMDYLRREFGGSKPQ
jgi:transcriptional regulator with XRE-family HTH domain